MGTPAAQAADAGAGRPPCRGLGAAVGANDLARIRQILATGCAPGGANGGASPLEQAISGGNVEATRLLLDAGADPDATDARGVPVSSWLGTRPGVSDENVLAVATLLVEHHCSFASGGASGAVDVVVNLAPRKMPRTLAFLVSKKVPGDYTRALKAIARGEDTESMKALLGAGADPLAGDALSSALLDAAAAGRTSSVTLMLGSVSDKSAAKVLAAYQASVRAGHHDTAQAFLDAGVKPPPPPTPLPCQPQPLTSDQTQLLARVGLSAVQSCKFLQQCGDTLLIDCNSAADGPAYYIDQKAGKILSTCGGACMRGCKNCPPPEWSCSCAR